MTHGWPASGRDRARVLVGQPQVSYSHPWSVVQDVLRHTNIRTTADRHTHLVPQVVGEALAAMDRAFLDEEAQ